MEPNGTVHSCCLDSTVLKVTISLVLTTLVLITIAGNVVVCLAVSLNRQLRSLTNCFIVSLAATDLLLGLLVLPFSAIYQLSFKWSFGQVFCNIYTSLDVMLCTASILNLFMISLDRYCAVTDPLRYPVLVTPVRVAISLIFIWVISITLSFLSIHLGWNSRNETRGGNDTFKCKVQVNEVYGLVDGLVTFYLPLLIMCVTYYRIFKIAREQAKRINHISSWKAATIREHKATVTLAAVMGAFIICWFPYFTTFVYRGLRGDDAINEVVEGIVLWLGYANSALNPILYAAFNRDFRMAYQQLFRCKLGSHNSHKTSLRLNNSLLSRSQSREGRWQEEKPLKLQVWSGTEITHPRGTPDRKPALSYTTCSSNLLSCCKSLWGLHFLQQHPEGPSEEQSGEPLSEKTERTPSQEGMRALPCEAV
ncbi:histamine H2 receptor [Peromyscus californicus insignis]|uniref:histamine H2 receptor n=1 Tax=Peromyscus californicus insignis TaxID=564181 RepID=UPI0022A7289A|nr:histamine H2 receptor [Peromyscus californicus insignis]XP_052584177.1 histamine H2 receptor [Peromyscus californicus insignis]